ncbi:MAG: hypothetical protein IKQ41_02935, partial [Clostridia bacterium]|nr:hypothetical protein [Clostridia bacterium]
MSEDYLSLASRNLAMVALASLGDAYGWDAGLNKEHEKAALWAKQTGVYSGMDGKFQANASLTLDAAKTMTEALLHEDVIG